MELDDLMRAPEIRWVFRSYAIAVGLAGFVLFGWGPVWLGMDLPGLPFYKASLVRVAGGILMAAGCFAAGLDGLESPRARRRGLIWLAAGHLALLLVMISQQTAIWNSRLANTIILFLVLAVFGFVFLWTGVIPGNGAGDQVISLFGTPPPAAETLEQRYQRQIRAAALQEERHRLARDLHDSVKQQIFAIQTAAATAQTRFDADPAGTREALEQVRASSREAMAEMEAMLDQLRAAPLETVGLVEALRKQSEALGFRTGAAVDFQLGGTLSGLKFAPGAQEALFRIAQEAFANIGRHARAAHVKAALFGDPHFLRLCVTDDGLGFDPAQPGRGMGIANMRSRAEEFGGKFELDSAPGKGTQILASVPVRPTFTVAQYNQRIFSYAAAMAVFVGIGVWRRSGVDIFIGGTFGFYAARVALARSAALRRGEAVR